MTPEETRKIIEARRWDLLNQAPEHVHNVDKIPDTSQVNTVDFEVPNLTRRMDIIGQNGNEGEHYGQVDTENFAIPNDSSTKQIGGSHYTEHKIQPWDIIDEYHLNFYEGNVLKYLLRNKGNRKEDIKKAIHYLEKILENWSR